jgi:molybdopterin converting factor small subunit
MPRATLELPSLLRAIVGREGALVVEGATLEEALADAFRQVPALRVHLLEESGAFRPHVLCFLNEVNTRWLEGLDQPIREGDTITILQAVSGGSR